MWKQIGSLAALAIVAGASATSAQDKQITVAWYGGNWGDAFKACVADPYTKATGVKVNAEVGTSTVTLGKLKAQKDAPSIDAAWMDGGISEVAAADGVVENLDPARLKNMANVDAAAVYKAGGITLPLAPATMPSGLFTTRAR